MSLLLPPLPPIAGMCINSLIALQSELDATKNQLATQRIAFEEEKLARLNDREGTDDSEAEALRIKLKQQVG